MTQSFCFYWIVSKISFIFFARPLVFSTDNETRDKYHEALMANNIFTVKVNLGIRVAICSLSVEKTKGLAKKMKDILDTIQ